jgi:hypothetical protein
MVVVCVHTTSLHHNNGLSNEISHPREY